MTTENPSPKPKKIKQPGRWRKRTIWGLSIFIIVVFTLRGILPLALPTVMRKIAGTFGLTCTYDRLELNLFNGDADMWGLEFKPKEGGQAILFTEYCHGNVSVLNLFRGKLNVWRVEADGVDVNLDRNPDGHIPLLDRFITATSKPTAAPAATTPSTPSTTPVDLASPIRVDALRLSHIRVHIHDRGITPEVDTELAMNLRLSDLGSTSTPAKFEMDLSADPLLDSMKITGEGTSGGKNLDASFKALIRGIRLKPAAAYLAPFGIKPVADGITLRAEGNIHTAPAPNNAEGFIGSIEFDHLAAVADRQEAMALDHLKIDAGVIDTKSARFNSIIADGARATAGRADDGNLQIAGIEYDPSLVAPTAPPPPAPQSAPSPILLTMLAERWSVGEIALRNARLDLHDQGITPPVDLSFIVDELAAKSIDHDPKNLNTTVTLTGSLRAPGLINDIKLDGSATPFADNKHFTATLNAIGIKPDAIKPYLDQAGLESTLKNGQFSAAIDASLSIGDTITAGTNVTKFDFRDEAPLLALSTVKVSNITLDPKTAKIGIADIELTGPGISVLRDSTGQLNALGLRTKPAVTAVKKIPAPRAVAATAPTVPPFSFASLPQFSLGKFSWTGIHLDLEDQTTNPPTKVSIPDIGISATNLSNASGQFKAWLNSPQLIQRLELNGTLSAVKDGLEVYAKLDGSGLNTTPLAPYLKPLGIEPILSDGSLIGSGTAKLVIDSSGPSASITMDGIKYINGTAVLAGVDEVTVSNARLTPDGIGVGNIYINHPHASARRDADGSLVAGGFRIPLAAKPPGDAPAAAAPIAPPITALAPPLIVSAPNININNASLDWTDLAVEPNVNTTGSATVQLRGVVLGKDAAPADLKLIAGLKDAVDEITVAGPIGLSPSQQSAALEIWMNGIHPNSLAGYFPPGIRSSLKTGRMHANLDAKLAPNKAGGIAASLQVGPVDFTDNDPMFRLDHPLFHMEQARVIIPRIDLPDTALAIDEVSVNGVQAHAERLPDGEIACMGLLLGAPSARPMKPAPATAPMTVIAAATPPPTTGPTAAELIAASHRTLPTVTLEKLDLNVSNFTFTDLSRPASVPLVLSDLRLHNVNRIDWLGKDAARKAPTHLNFTCKISPLVEQVMVDAMLSPFAQQPNLQIDFAATGVHGDGLTKLVPELKDQIDGSAMDNAIASGHFEAEAKLDRRSPIDFDVSRGFDLSFDLTKVQYRDHPDGPVLAGVDEVKSDNIRIAPADSLLHFKTVEIDKPIGLVTQDIKGIHALGWVYKLSTTQPVAVTKAEPTTAPVVVAESEKPKGEIRIDKLLIDGLDFRVEDNAVTPPMVIPLNGLDVEVRNISSLSPYEDKPVRFSAIVNADKVKLRKKGAPGLEDRDLFSQITADGEVSLYPQLHGWAKTSVSGLDLAALQGPAKQLGENLSAGVYDSNVDLRFDPTGAVAITSKFTLTDLSLSEPPNGLIYRTLHLPAPLDVAIGAVEDADGSIGLPLNVSLKPKHISYADLGLAAAGGVSQVLVTALAAAPLKAANDVGGIIGLGNAQKPAEELTTTIPFSPGSAAIGADQFSDLVPLLTKLKKDDSLTVTIRHQLGDGDVQIASIRANPSLEQCKALEVQLRSRKTALLQLRADTAGQARAQLVSLGSTAAEPTLQRLRAIDRELAGVEESLDQLGDLLRPGADKSADRRTRSAALHIANNRLSAIQSLIVSEGISTDRVKTITAAFKPEADLDGGEILITAIKKKN